MEANKDFEDVIMLRNIIGPSFDSILDQVWLNLFDIFGPFLQKMPKPLFYSVFSKNMNF